MIIYGTQNVVNYTIGGKAASLVKLKDAGYNVPDFLIIPAEAFDRSLKVNVNNEDPLSQKIENLLNFRLSPDEQQKVKDILASWDFPSQRVAVRSSVADEDSEKDAFAGLMDTFMNLVNFEDVLSAIANCAVSAFSERAIAYRKQKSLTLNARPAVIIQKQIVPDVSVVVFSTFPEYPEEMAIHAVFGFGEGLVSGALDADEYYLSKKNGQIVSNNIVAKDQSYRLKEGGGLELSPVAHDLQSKNCLSEQCLSEIFKIASELEVQAKHPQDIELVIKNEEIFLVQSRPVTQPIPEVIVYDNSNIQESYCGVTTPLTFSFAQGAYATVYRQTMEVLGLPNSVITRNREVVTNLLGLVRGRIYYNINNWYQGLQLLPSFSQNKADMERMMGLEEPVDFVESRKKSLLEKLKLLPRLANLLRLFYAFGKLNQSVQSFHSHFQKKYREFYSNDLGSLDYEKLVGLKTKLDQEILTNWTTPIINDFYVMMTNGKVMRQLKAIGFTEPENFLSAYLSGVLQVESTKPIKELQDLAESAKMEAELACIIQQQSDGIHENVRANYPAFYKLVQNYIDHFSDRVAGELKLETRTMRTNPEILYKYLKTYLEADLFTGESNFIAHEQAKQQLNAKLKQASNSKSKAVFSKLEKLQQAIRYRESMRLERTRLFGMYRSVYLNLGSILAKENLIEKPQDVFYLTENEIITNINSLKNLKETIVQRKNEFAKYELEEVESRVLIPSRPGKPKTFEPVAGILRGAGCSPGMVEGEVVVITNTNAIVDVKGKIVCALRTDPGWAVIFPSCKGVLIEKGSALSHSVILLRELQIPAIINIRDLTKALKSGQRVRMDASIGEIKILKNED